MGNCSDCCKPKPISDPGKLTTAQSSKVPNAPLASQRPDKFNQALNQKSISLALRYDTGNNMCTSYRTSQNTIEKTINNWHSFPIISKIQQSQAIFFRITNCGVKNENFLVGIIKLTAINGMAKVPWKTSHAICYESHHQTGQSGIIFDNNIVHSGRGVKKGETITIIIRREQIEFKIQKQVLGKKRIPSEFYTDYICPYICLFNKGDSIQFPDGISIDHRGR